MIESSYIETFGEAMYLQLAQKVGLEEAGRNGDLQNLRLVCLVDVNAAVDVDGFGAFVEGVSYSEDLLLFPGQIGDLDAERYNVSGAVKSRNWDSPELFALSHLILDRRIKLQMQSNVAELAGQRLDEALDAVAFSARQPIFVANVHRALETTVGVVFVIAGERQFSPEFFAALSDVAYLVLKPSKVPQATYGETLDYYGSLSPANRRLLKIIWLGARAQRQEAQGN